MPWVWKRTRVSVSPVLGTKAKGRVPNREARGVWARMLGGIVDDGGREAEAAESVRRACCGGAAAGLAEEATTGWRAAICASAGMNRLSTSASNRNRVKGRMERNMAEF